MSSIENTSLLSDFTIFPNPTESEFTINMSEEITGNAFAVIYNSLGEKFKAY
ncbi:MAG: hypothetical protein IPL24_14895 [Bacteroidetes bacterium]|nr:hypothetical protein [Bacteroidota bacterium]